MRQKWKKKKRGRDEKISEYDRKGVRKSERRKCLREKNI